jgi:hypothetical protein
MRPRAALLTTVVVVVLLVAGGAAGWRWWHHRAPYGPEALDATATLLLVDQATADAAMAPGTAEHAGAGDQIFLGRVTWARPAGARAGGSFRVVVLDKRSHRTPGVISVSSPRPDEVNVGSDDSLDVAEDRYSWLRGIGGREVNGSVWSGGTSIMASPAATPVSFVFVLHPARPETPPELVVATAPAAVADLLVALVNVGPSGQVHWAQRLLN